VFGFSAASAPIHDLKKAFHKKFSRYLIYVCILWPTVAAAPH
jgi:hypothetical protein